MILKSNKNKFVEGETYQFKVNNITCLPGGNKEFFVLQDIFGNKQLMSTEYYKNYDIKKGRIIKCKVDKINCNGKIFLEPEHPIYKQGKIYDFEFVKFDKQKNYIGYEENIIIVKDAFKNLIKIHCNNKIHVENNKVKAKVEFVKKSIPFLSLTEYDDYKTLKIGNTCLFTIVDKKKLHDNVEYFILNDKYNNTHFLPTEYYPKYNFKIGQKIRCKVINYSLKGYYFIEPEHPFYNEGEIYEFDFIRAEKSVDSQGVKKNYLVVKDYFDNEIHVEYDLFIEKKNIDFTKVKCRVENLKKGKLLLSEPIEFL
ncbi:MAG: hypothetical protein DRJ01_10850 [Bacteroidetes bacterium]|nr:MAG: hypothetical protein DRJ01_10850 [Bacteroidota bacterium]